MPAFNPLIARLSPPPIPSVLAWAKAYDGSRGQLIDLSQAVPGYPPHPHMLNWLSEMAGSRDYTSYGAIEGEDVLRVAYAQHMTEVYAAPVAADNIHITSGANQAFMCVAMAVTGYGDTVAMTNPYYFNQETTLAMLGIKSTLIACDPQNSFLPNLETVRAALVSGVKALVLVTPNNPTGAVYPSGLLREIFMLCRQNGTWLILDETYRDFLAADAGAPHDLLSIPGWEDNLALTYSFSKSYCIPGHRLGAITAGAEMVDQVAKIMDNLQICAPRAPQAAVAKAIPALRDWRIANRAEIAGRADALRDVMSRLPHWGLQALGAYFAYIKHPFEGVRSEVVAEKLAREAGIVCLPGVYFGEGQESYLRFAFANADAPTIRLLEARLANFTL
ncbi:aminotransferase [Rhizobium sp. KVB221]|uniref:aspartate transaminase n=1 Tax=Rhizobium setariae TaxID=2801340 RepID=A0A936YQ41_9HYPH|nr:aminotransferase [Rhizobium setariae]MBL0373608.1 aminotransferase [Rhizobium setariae]